MTSATDSQLDSLVGALVEANDQLLALYELASLSVDTLDEITAVTRILDRAHELLKTDCLMLVTDSVANSHESSDSDPDSDSVSDSGLDTNSNSVLLAGNPQRFTELLATNNLASADQISQMVCNDTEILMPAGWSATSVSISSGRLLPLIASRSDKPFGTADRKLLNAVAKLLAGVVNTAQLHKTALAQAVIERDHLIASELAQKALPHVAPVVPGVEVFARSDPAHTSGGDLYAWAVVDEVLCFAMGDVAGKGLPAAITMTNMISAINACFGQFGTAGPAEVLRSVDRWMSEPLSAREVFVTLVVGSYDPAGRILRVANAGHSPVMYSDGGALVDIPAHHPPVGVVPIDELLETVIAITPGDLFLAASDGLTEQQNPSGSMLGDQAIAEAVKRMQSLSAPDLGARLFGHVEQFAATTTQSDDRTLLCLKFGNQQ